jgi:hypothetical protein
MTLDSLSESSLVRLENYLNSNPYREYSMNKPYFPKVPDHLTHSNRLIPQQQSSILAFQELMDNQKNSVTLDRLAYKLRMKSDLNIDTLRETHIRRRYNQRHQHFHPQQSQHFHPQQTQHFHPQQTQQNHINLNISDSLSSIPPSTSTKTFPRQPTSITMSSHTMKTLINEDLNGIEGNAIRVGTLNDLIKQFRLVRRPPDYLDSSSTYLSSNVSTNDRTIITKPHHQQQQQQQRPIKQPQALTEYRFNVPTIPTTPSRTTRDPTIHQGLIYQYRTRERIQNNDLPLLNQRSINTPEQTRQRVNSLVIQERQATVMSSHDKRIQELREKSLMRTEKQLCVCNKLTIVDPFNSNSEQFDSTLPQLQQAQQQLQASYIFPPVRPFGNLTKKTNDDTQLSSWTQTSSQRTKKKYGMKKKHQKNSLDSLDKIDIVETNDEDDSQIFNETIKSMVSLTDFDDDIQYTSNTTLNVDLNIAGDILTNTNEQDESKYF